MRLSFLAYLAVYRRALVGGLAACFVMLSSSYFSPAAAAACYPSCLEDLKAMCVPVAPCTKGASTQPDTFNYCFSNGVKIASATDNETRTKPDGSLCYSADVTMNAEMVTYAWKNGTGALVATETFDGAVSGGRYHVVTCGGTSYTVDMGSADCQAEQMQQNPDGDAICTQNAACIFSATGGGGGGAAGAGMGGAGGGGTSGGAGGGGTTGGAGGGGTSGGGTNGEAGGRGGAGPAGGGPAGGSGGVGGSGPSSPCPLGRTLCGGLCVDEQVDSTNCGACGQLCDTAHGSSCLVGACAVVITSCPVTGQVLCGAVCVNPRVDPHNCGACGTTCQSQDTCTSGVCSTPDSGGSCAVGQRQRPGLAAGIVGALLVLTTVVVRRSRRRR